MKQFFKIGEISRLYHIGPDSLRYYEKLGILTPKRDTNDYRMYSLDDLWRLNVIRDLRSLGFPMSKIQEYMQNRSVLTTTNLLKEELEIIDSHIRLLDELKNDVKERLDTLEESQQQPLNVITRKRFPLRHCHKNMKAFKTDEEMDLLTKQLLNKDKNNLYIIGNNRIGSFLPLDSAKKSCFNDYTGVFIIDKNGPDVIESGEYLSVSFHGNSQQYETFFPMLEEYALKNALTLSGPILEILWVDIHQASDPGEHITEIQIKCN